MSTADLPVNPVTGLQHMVVPAIKGINPPKALLWVGNSLFFFNNGSHRFMRRILQKAPGAPKCRTNLVAIGGASLSWHDLESYFRPNAIGSYSFSSDGNNTVQFRDPSEQLWDSVLLLDSTQGPIHPQLKENFRQFGKKDAEICRSHNATPIFVISWAYRDRPEMTAQLADSIISVANENAALAVPAGLHLPRPSSVTRRARFISPISVTRRRPDRTFWPAPSLHLFSRLTSHKLILLVTLTRPWLSRCVKLRSLPSIGSFLDSFFGGERSGVSIRFRY